MLDSQGTIHHLGFVLRSITASAEDFAKSVAGRWPGEIFHDPIQRVRVSFIYPIDDRNPVFELIEPAAEDSPVTKFLAKGGGLHHVCYEVENLAVALKNAATQGLLLVAKPVPAVAFGGRKIAWVCSKNRLLVELLERDAK